MELLSITLREMEESGCPTCAKMPVWNINIFSYNYTTITSGLIAGVV
jgi:hypothetical protein